jgi:hypothetical protein
LESRRPTEIVLVEGLMDDLSASAKPRLPLDHLLEIEDARQLWRVAYPRREIRFPVVCGTIASGDDYDDIVGRGTAYLGMLREISEILCKRLPRGRQKHGHGLPLRPQSSVTRRRQTIHPATPQTRLLGS